MEFGEGEATKQRSVKKSTWSPSEGHNPPRGSPRKFASQRALQGSLRGLRGVSPRSPRGSAGVRGTFRGFSGVVTLRL